VQSASLPPDEPARLRALESYDVLDTEPEQAFDEVARLAARICAAPISLVSLVDESRQWFKSCWGLDARETPRSVALSAHAILSCEQVMVVEDARQDERFRDNPLVTGAPHIRFYAGAPLVAPAGHVLGTLCVIDTEPRGLDDLQRTSLQVLASQVVVQLELRKKVRELDAARNVAEQADTAKSMFLANMSHEIRTPLNAILGVAELLHETPLSSQQAQYVSLFRSSGQRLLDLINDILDLSKIEAGKVELAESRFALRPSLESVAEALAVSAARKWIDLVLDVEPDVPDGVLGDEPRLRQVLVNLIGNAIKFTERGSVRLVLRTSGAGESERVELDIVDSGIGIPPEHLPFLFEPFHQVDNSLTRQAGGTGIGLTITRRLAELLNGDVRVTSEEGVGSTFTVDLPLGDLEGVRRITELGAEPTRPEATRGVGGIATLRGNVLLAEDTPVNQKLITAYLERAGASVTVVENGRLAVEKALESGRSGRPFDLVLMDMQMPVLDGYEAARALRDAGYAGPIVALTAHAMEGDREKCLAAGCTDYTRKPVDRAELLRICATRMNPAAPLPDRSERPLRDGAERDRRSPA
jgi:signal transduction histidine kinase/ActR/RegA family two-component response regulator